MDNAQKHRCGRREPWVPDSPFVYDQAEHGDEYRDGRCTYCGSVSQAAFLKFVEEGGELGPTDKSYKVYLHDTKDADGHVVRAPGIKFYFQHLDDQGKHAFIALYNAKKMNIGNPGHFYTRPYFCVPAEETKGP